MNDSHEMANLILVNDSHEMANLIFSEKNKLKMFEIFCYFSQKIDSTFDETISMITSLSAKFG